jgi:hypothetical protein
MTQLDPAGTTVEQLFASAKSPVASIFPIVSATSPLLPNVTVWVPLEPPTLKLEKVRLAGVSATMAPEA